MWLSNFVSQSKLKAVKEGLSSLMPNQFLTIHGMTGSGKSVLAAESIRDPEITLRHFPDGVFWFRVGMLENPDKLLNRYKKYPRNIFKNKTKLLQNEDPLGKAQCKYGKLEQC